MIKNYEKNYYVADFMPIFYQTDSKNPFVQRILKEYSYEDCDWILALISEVMEKLQSKYPNGSWKKEDPLVFVNKAMEYSTKWARLLEASRYENRDTIIKACERYGVDINGRCPELGNSYHICAWAYFAMLAWFYDNRKENWMKKAEEIL